MAAVRDRVRDINRSTVKTSVAAPHTAEKRFTRKAKSLPSGNSVNALARRMYNG